MLKLESKEQEIVEVSQKMAGMSNLIADMLETNTSLEEVIPLPKYNAAVLRKVAEYCELVDYSNESRVEKPVLKPDLETIFSTEKER